MRLFGRNGGYSVEKEVIRSKKCIGSIEASSIEKQTAIRRTAVRETAVSLINRVCPIEDTPWNPSDHIIALYRIERFKGSLNWTPLCVSFPACDPSRAFERAFPGPLTMPLFARTEKSFPNRIKSNPNQFVFTMQRLIWDSKRMHPFAVLNWSENSKYSRISVWFEKISLCAY